ncbi:methyl-accepting chemotaxis protein [Frigidibacter sp. MR17.24]|uniref:methyl-accepting chemotaxis protein n=1 Tax=Frigidibacter sp. MR17.24 TaxID=3127345 RepID=UPI003012E895
MPFSLRLSLRLPLLIVLVSLASLVVMGSFALREAGRALSAAGQERLAVTAEMRRENLDLWSARITSDLATMAGTASVQKALADLTRAFDRRGPGAAAELQREYITDNPNPAGRRHLLETAGGLDDYSVVHRRVHPEMAAHWQQTGYYDIFLIDAAGRVVYSLFKEEDFTADLMAGPLRDTGLAQVARAALSAGPGAPPSASDFRPYAPSAGAAAAFVAQPVFDRGGQRLGALAFQLPFNQINAITVDRTGLGDSGRAYLVGPDNRLRTNVDGGAPDTLEQRQTALPEVALALAGGQGAQEGVGIDGVDAVIAYGPVSMLGLPQALVVEQDRSEILAPVHRLAREVAGWGALLMLAVAGLAWWLGRGIARPLGRTCAAMAEVAQGRYDATIPALTRRDEIGDIARGLEAFRGSLAEGKQHAEAAAFRGAAFDGTSAPLMMVDENFEVKFVNPALYALFDVRRDDFAIQVPQFDPKTVIGKTMDVFHVIPSKARALLSDSRNLPHQAEIGVGSARFQLNVSEVQMEGRGRIGYVVEWRDVTAERLTSAILGALDRSQAMAQFQPDGQLVVCNALFAGLAGQAPEALVGQAAAMMFRPEGAKDLEPAWRGLTSGEVWQGRLAFGTSLADGLLAAVLDRSGRVMRIVLIASDVTEVQTRAAAAERERVALAEAQRHAVSALASGLGRLAGGDLMVRIDERFSADYEGVRGDFNRAMAQLSETIGEVAERTDSLSSGSTEISTSAEDLSRRAERQAATLEQTAAALDQLTASVKSAASGAAEAQSAVEVARGAAERSGKIVDDAVLAMEQIEASSQEISRIIGVIDDIAFQTNLLALNAGVEAARAGEAGRGFAVVASEVRALAQRSSEAAREIDGLIARSGGHVRTGVELVGKAGGALREILTGVTDITTRVSEIAGSASEQSAGLAEINIAINQLDQVTQQNAGMFEQTAAASRSISDDAASLARAVAKFQITDGTPARGASVEWRHAG